MSTNMNITANSTKPPDSSGDVVVKSTREAFGLTQEEMAIALDLNSDRAVRAYEQRTRAVSGPIRRLCGYMIRFGLLPEVQKTIAARRKTLNKP